MYEILLTNSAVKDYNNIPNSDVDRVSNAIDKLKEIRGREVTKN